MTSTDATVADVLAAAAATGAPTEVVVEVLRTHLDLGTIGVNHALPGIDAAQYLRPGVRRVPAVVAAADQLWACVEPHPMTDPIPDVGSDWQAAAACRGKDPALWFCDPEDKACDDEIEAVSTCLACPVIGQCALAAINEQDGLWAGMTERNRSRLRRYLRRGVVPATPAAVGPLAADIGSSALAARLASTPTACSDDGALFDVPESVEVSTHRQRRDRRAASSLKPIVDPLFV